MGNGPPDRFMAWFESPCHTKMKHTLLGALRFGGLEGIRTLDPHNANVVRSQLRYKPISSSIDWSIIHPFPGNVK